MKDKIAQAMELHQQGRFEEAELAYHELLAEHPENADILHLLAIVTAQRENYGQAQKLIEKAINIDPNSATFYNSLGNILKKQDKIRESLAAYQQAIDLEPYLASAHNNIAILYQYLNQPQQAAHHYQQAINARPNYPDAYFNYSALLFQLHEDENALVHLKKTLELQPQHRQALARLGQFYYERGEYAKACEYYLRANRLAPEHAENLLNQAACLMKLNQLDAAIKLLEKVIKLDPANSEAFHNLGAIYLTQHNTNKALTMYLHQLSIKADSDAYYNAGVIYMYQNRFNDAITYLERALEMKPNDYNTTINLATTYLKKEDYSHAKKYYEQALLNSPDNAEINYILSAISQDRIPDAAPKDYVQHLFDQYAPYYEQHLQEHLHYQVPTLIQQALCNELGDKLTDLVILDLGCGTGLTGEKIKKFAAKLIGSDISSKMIEQAQLKNIYDELEVKDINESLEMYENIDVIIAADVFGYIGNLTTIFQCLNKCLTKSGLFIFTIEKNSINDTYHLQKSARYAHHLDYIHKLANQNKLALLREDAIILRQQKGEPVAGYLYILKANAYY